MTPVLVLVWLLLSVCNCSAQRTQNRTIFRNTARVTTRAYQTSPTATQNRIGNQRALSHSRAGQASIPHQVTRFIESYFMVDQSGVEQFRQHGFELIPTISEMITRTNFLFLDLNMWLVLVGLETWNASLPWPINYTYQIINETRHINSSAMSRNLGDYRLNFLMKQRNLSVDHIHLLTGEPIAVDKKSAIGAGPFDGMCSIMSATIVSVPQILETKSFGKDYNIEALAILLAHEVGHTLNLSHDVNVSRTETKGTPGTQGTPSCQCADGQCVMWPTAGHKGFESIKWTDCRKRQLRNMSNYPRDVCLTNMPSNAGRSEAKCGDFVLQLKEQCDCGPALLCARNVAHCCNPSTCQLRYSAYQCASGSCCNLTTCGFAAALEPCRPSVDECDLTEYCNGNGANCPEDTWKADGTPCAANNGFCFKGKCKSMENQCKAMFGRTAHARRLSTAKAACFKFVHCTYLLDEVLSKQEIDDYKQRTSNDWEFDCNVNNITYENRDYGCTQLACEIDSVKRDDCKNARNPLKAFLDFKMLSHHNLVGPGADFELSVLSAKRDMRLIENGTKCGPANMCYNQVCRSIESLEKSSIVRRCRRECPAGTVCNNKGECQKLETSEVIVTATPEIESSTSEVTTTTVVTVINEKDSSGIMERLLIIIVTGCGVSLILTGLIVMSVCCCRRKRQSNRKQKTRNAPDNSAKSPCSFSASPKSKRYSAKANIRPTGLPICSDGEKQYRVSYATEDVAFF